MFARETRHANICGTEVLLAIAALSVLHGRPEPWCVVVLAFFQKTPLTSRK
jgi:hypothetical protein